MKDSIHLKRIPGSKQKYLHRTSTFQVLPNSPRAIVSICRSLRPIGGVIWWSVIKFSFPDQNDQPGLMGLSPFTACHCLTPAPSPTHSTITSIAPETSELERVYGVWWLHHWFLLLSHQVYSSTPTITTLTPSTPAIGLLTGHRLPPPTALCAQENPVAREEEQLATCEWQSGFFPQLPTFTTYSVAILEEIGRWRAATGARAPFGATPSRLASWWHGVTLRLHSNTKQH